MTDEIKVPEPEREATPILRAKEKPTLPCPCKVPVPAVPATRLSKMDYFCMGSRRALKTALYGGAGAAAVAGVGVMLGSPFVLAFKGAAMIVAGSSIAMGAAKIREEKVKQDGGTPTVERIICAIISALVLFFESRKKK